MGLQQVGKFKLDQDGAYVARTEFHFMGDDGQWHWCQQSRTPSQSHAAFRYCRTPKATFEQIPS